VVKLLERVTQAGVEFVKTEGLYNFDGKAGFAKGEGFFPPSPRFLGGDYPLGILRRLNSKHIYVKLDFKSLINSCL
jgi:hypothetical protein